MLKHWSVILLNALYHIHEINSICFQIRRKAIKQNQSSSEINTAKPCKTDQQGLCNGVSWSFLTSNLYLKLEKPLLTETRVSLIGLFNLILLCRNLQETTSVNLISENFYYLFHRKWRVLISKLISNKIAHDQCDLICGKISIHQGNENDILH